MKQILRFVNLTGVTLTEANCGMNILPSQYIVDDARQLDLDVIRKKTKSGIGTIVTEGVAKSIVNTGLSEVLIFYPKWQEVDGVLKASLTARLITGVRTGPPPIAPFVGWKVPKVYTEALNKHRNVGSMMNVLLQQTTETAKRHILSVFLSMYNDLLTADEVRNATQSINDIDDNEKLVMLVTDPALLAAVSKDLYNDILAQRLLK